MAYKINPDYEQAEYSECIHDYDGKVIFIIARYRTLDDAINKMNPVSKYITEEEQDERNNK